MSLPKLIVIVFLVFNLLLNTTAGIRKRIKSFDDYEDIPYVSIYKSNALNYPHKSEELEEGAFCRRSFDGRAGYCVYAPNCLHAITEHRIHGATIDVCTRRNNIAVICCVLSDKLSNFRPRKSSEKCLEYYKAANGLQLGKPHKFLNQGCNVAQALIVGGGKVTRRNQYPHMAAIGWSREKEENKWKCGGALISEKYVLTAGHCISSFPETPDTVLLGVKNLNDTSKHRVTITIIMVIMYPLYHPSSYNHDVALVKLSRKVRFSSYIRPACLWQFSYLNTTRVTAIGWGQTDIFDSASNNLQEVELRITEQNKCKETYQEDRRLANGITDNQFCAGITEGGMDTCEGDSGGPVYVEVPQFNCHKFLIGVTSFGKSCATAKGPGVYTNIYFYLEWIERVVFSD